MTTPRPAVSGEAVFALVLLAVGGVVLVEGIRYGITDDGRIGAGGMPFLAGSVLGLTAVVNLVLALRGPSPVGENQIDDPLAAVAMTAEPPRANATIRSLATLALLAVALLAGDVVGFIPALVVGVFAIALLIERVPVRMAALLAAVCGVILWAIFEALLDVPNIWGLFG